MHPKSGRHLFAAQSHPCQRYRYRRWLKGDWRKRRKGKIARSVQLEKGRRVEGQGQRRSRVKQKAKLRRPSIRKRKKNY